MQKTQLDQNELSLADNEEILHALSKLTPVYENPLSAELGVGIVLALSLFTFLIRLI